ncbi:MAG: DUF4419 domain-containing protein [Lentisphaerae bacterium]|nr:DUF4419 domain-containing protein [Lentisphaerota bacterium]MCP4103003.1 DUF4419 domain-containing protein [Lentisphaerota bacterium]
MSFYAYSQFHFMLLTGKKSNGITFNVDKVKIASKALPESEVKKFLALKYGKFESYSRKHRQLVCFLHHPFIMTVNHAFSDHRPIVISPDHIWLLILQGFANHVKCNSEKLRYELVKHSGKITHKVIRNDFVMGKIDNPWEEVFSQFSKEINRHINPEL